MKKSIIKKLGLFMGVSLVLYLIVNLTVGFPLIYESNTGLIDSSNREYKQGDTIQPLNDLEFDEIYIWTSKDDYNELPKEFEASKLKKISDKQTILEIKSKLNFIYTGGDVATCESKVYFISNGKVVFKSNLLMSKNRFGLQSKYGWIESINSEAIINLMSNAKSIHQPFKIL